MPNPTATAIFYSAVAWLACWDIDLLLTIAQGQVLADLILKFIVVTICLIIVLLAGYRAGFLLHG